jgi:glucose-1-phosphate thymidylyltransferase
VKALILAAGYATRLRPLTDDFPKSLLPVGGRPLVDWIVDKIRDAGIDDIHLVTNARFAPQFDEWAATSGVTIHDDGTASNETRLGAIGDIRFVDLRDDLLVVAGDNLFDFSVGDFVAFWRAHGDSAVAVYDVGDRELVKKYSVVELVEDRIVRFEEKPADPQSTLIATATYLFSSADVARVGEYLADGNPPDQPGNYVGWLVRTSRIYGYPFAGEWYDIGDLGQLLEADNRLRERLGLPRRASYTVDD